MFSKLANFFRNVEQTIEHDVEAIISNFTSTVAKLEAAAEHKLEQVAYLTTTGTNYINAAEVEQAAADKAKAVADKIKALVA
jgi:hypothetical protein